MTDLTPTELLLVEQRVTNEGKTVGIAFALWFVLGILSGHRFYLDRPGSALLQMVSYVFLIGFAWWLFDAFFIPTMVREHNEGLRQHYIDALRAKKEAPPA